MQYIYWVSIETIRFTNFSQYWRVFRHLAAIFGTRTNRTKYYGTKFTSVVAPSIVDGKDDLSIFSIMFF